VATHPFRNSLHPWRLLLVTGFVTAVAGETHAQPPNDAAALLTNAGKAVVQIIDEDRFCITGVSVSADGHVLSRGLLSRSLVKVRFSDGRTASARFLGWSLEWDIGVWKIVDEGVWPYVELGSTADAYVGQPVGLIDYRTDEESAQDRQLVVRYAAIEHVDPSKWLVTTGVGGTFEFPPLFSMDGRLMGFTNTAYGGDTRKIATAAEVVTENWRDLVAGKNLDWVRYPPREGSPWRPDFVPSEEPASGDEVGQASETGSRSLDLATAKKIARDTTVRIESKPRMNFNGSAPERWSGVIVSEDGHILSCGHTEQLPGEQVTVRLSDRRDFNGVVLGSNWVSDVGLVKITDLGVWPVAKIVDSSPLGVGDPLVTCGYPAMTLDGKPSTDRSPVVSVVSVRRQRPHRLWRRELPMTNDGVRRGGMSGGGVFDSKGRYVGIFGGTEATRSEMARVQWDHLAGEEPSLTPENASAKRDAN